MSAKIIHERALRAALRILALTDNQLELIDAMRKATCARRDTLMEMVRANYSGDKAAFEALGASMLAAKGQGSTYRYYSGGITDTMRTKQIAKQAMEWVTNNAEVSDEQDNAQAT